MIISFDIDNTLIPYSGEFPLEPGNILTYLLGVERIRQGTVDLFKILQGQGHKIQIYTTSFRSQFYLWKTFAAYGLFVDRIINGRINQSVLKQHKCSASKNPLLFNIDLHIDDAPGVAQEGKNFNFRVLLISINDKNWTDTILRELATYA